MVLKSSLHKATCPNRPSDPKDRVYFQMVLRNSLGQPLPTFCLFPGDWTLSQQSHRRPESRPYLLTFPVLLQNHGWAHLLGPMFPPDSCIQLQKCILVELVFWLLFKAIVPVKPQGPSRTRSSGVDEWAGPTAGLSPNPWGRERVWLPLFPTRQVC